jgi:hypothetical protein
LRASEADIENNIFENNGLCIDSATIATWTGKGAPQSSGCGWRGSNNMPVFPDGPCLLHVCQKVEDEDDGFPFESRLEFYDDYDSYGEEESEEESEKESEDEGEDDEGGLTFEQFLRMSRLSQGLSHLILDASDDEDNDSHEY